MRSRDKARARSGGMCEAMVLVENRVWTRCGIAPVEMHHRLTRGRGGRLLDEIGESYHLMDLCRDHHEMADGELAYLGGLLLDGMMIKEGSHLYYTGTDEYLARTYPRPLPLRDLSVAQAGAESGPRLREEVR